MSGKQGPNQTKGHLQPRRGSWAIPRATSVQRPWLGQAVGAGRVTLVLVIVHSHPHEPNFYFTSVGNLIYDRIEPIEPILLRVISGAFCKQ